MKEYRPWETVREEVRSTDRNHLNVRGAHNVNENEV